jgi:hypothetical protein
MREIGIDPDESDDYRPVSVPEKKSHSVVALLTCLVIGGGLLLLVCCGGLFHLGMGAYSDGVWQKVESDSRFTAHVGQVKNHQMQYGASFSAEEDVFVYDVEATKWSGRVTVKYVDDDDGGEQILWIRFTLPSGEIVELTPEVK